MPFLNFESSQPLRRKLRSLARSGLLLTTSAALGGIAVAIWNRRTLAEIRRDPQDPEFTETDD